MKNHYFGKYKLLLFLLFFHSSLCLDYCEGQWILQTVPITSEASSLVFFDANTGVMASWNNDIGYILRTTNSGFNWIVMNNMTGSGVHSLQKIDSTTIYGKGGNNGYLAIYRTYDRGLTWDSVSKQNSLAISSIYFIDRDTGWYSAYAIPSYTIWKTTNGGVSMFQISVTGGAYGSIFFLKEKVNGQYWGWVAADGIYRTMNGGLNWYNAANLQADIHSRIFFINKDTGWVSSIGFGAQMYVTYNGGQNWILQPMPALEYSGIADFVFTCKGIMYGVGGGFTINNRAYGVVWKTTNYGNNWGYQIPDTSYHYSGLYISAVDSLTVWAYQYNKGIHTTNGGGQIIYTGINQHSSNVSTGFVLFQNYPNPFNSESKIKYKISREAEIKLMIYNTQGQEIDKLVNKKQSSGVYEVKFNGNNLSSGVYFYILYADGIRIETKKMSLIK